MATREKMLWPYCMGFFPPSVCFALPLMMLISMGGVFTAKWSLRIQLVLLVLVIMCHLFMVMS